MPPNIIDDDSSADATVREGGNVTLECRAAGHPTPRIVGRREDGGPIGLGKFKGVFFALPVIFFTVGNAAFMVGRQ